MSAQPRNVRRSVARITNVRPPTTATPRTATAASARPALASETRREPAGSPRLPVHELSVRKGRDDVIVGHWVANGRPSVHPPGQPCGLCGSNGKRILRRPLIRQQGGGQLAGEPVLILVGRPVAFRDERVVVAGVREGPDDVGRAGLG